MQYLRRFSWKIAIRGIRSCAQNSLTDAKRNDSQYPRL